MKSYTDIEQSKKLAVILPIESADMYYSDDEYPKLITKYQITYANTLYGSYNIRYFNIFGYTPCWSLAALLGVLPEGIIKDCYAPNLQKENSKYSIAYGNDELLCIADNPLDAVFEMIMKLHKQNLL